MEVTDAKGVIAVRKTLAAGETVGLVGESGCGKSVLLASLVRLLAPGLRVSGGTATFDGVDLLSIPESVAQVVEYLNRVKPDGGPVI